MAIFFLIFALIVAIGAVVFALQNSIQVTVALFAWSFSGSLSLILLGTLILGVLIGLLVLLPGSIKRSFQFSGLRRSLNKLKKEKAKVVPAGIDKGSQQATSAPIPEVPADDQAKPD